MKPLIFFAVLFGLITVYATSVPASTTDSEADYDRLDGTGKSGKKVQVIEWEGNLEIHVYPAGSLLGLGLTLDKKNKDKPVMVISYRFDNSDHPLIRRAILGIDLKNNFKAYKDPSAEDYDKIVISNNGLSTQVSLFKLDPPPTQLYPDGHPMNTVAKKETPEASTRKPAKEEAPKPPVDDNGTIQPFFMRSENSRSENPH